MKFEAKDKKKGMSLAELKETVERLEGLIHASGLNPQDVKIRAWTTLSASIKSLEVI